ncbi:hypothetical protein B1748_15810 [Paenibacillus sp. MY03]|uniref:hypothetical protein n=1 Tax=Paenibacillus sp. MY03 TaxID=302980 RepID=UPI000B3BF3AD|nr:hypothetical protein [Paenibacillus sp. MY03]OUS75574.1 hypothetical protein B1748_15810 [Paenibacillus sp. MY03]
MWADLAAFIKANTTETLLISIIGTILIWMYKQFKGMIDREEQDKLATVQLKMGLFTKLELAIASVIHLKNEESKRHMYTLLGECGPYLTKMQRTVVRDYYKHLDSAFLHSLQVLTVNEVDKLTRQLESMMEYKDNGEWLNYIKRLYAPLWPILLIGILVLYIVFIIKLVRQGGNLWVQFNISLFGITLFVAATFVFSAIFFLIRREMGKQGARRWGAIILVIFSPLLIFMFNRFDVSIVVIIIQALSIAFISFSNRPVEIVKI